MPTLTTTVDGNVACFNQSSWANARDATTGTFSGAAGTRNTQTVVADKRAGRGGGTTYNVSRTFFSFDTSGISVAPTDATLKIFGYFNAGADFFVVKSTHTNLNIADFDSIDGWSSGADNSSNVTKYSSEVSTWNGFAYNSITLNSDALNAMASESTFKICLIESDFDLTNTEPGDTTLRRTGMYFVEFSGTSTDPIIDYTAAGVSGYGHDVIGVSSGDIDTVIGVATADIDNVIDVS